MTHGFGTPTAPDGATVYNPAFDVTPAGFIAGNHHRPRHRRAGYRIKRERYRQLVGSIRTNCHCCRWPLGRPDVDVALRLQLSRQSA